MSAALEIRNLHVSVGDQPILNGIELLVKQGEIHALMGPNGSGKSTLAYTLAGHPAYEPSAGQVIFNGIDLLELEADERSRAGLFLAFQYPVEIPGVSTANFLKSTLNAVRKEQGKEELDAFEILKLLKEKEKMDMLGMDYKFAGRYLNDGFSGGEKKRSEILQMATLEPKIAIMDETDSGLDIDALRIVAEGANALREKLNMGVLVITHYQRILNYIQPDHVHVMLQGRIVESGGPELALALEEKGYDWLREKHGTLEEA